MTPYEAVHATADLFDRRPDLYDFFEVEIPECGTPGCALGHIGRLSGLTRDICVIDISLAVLGCEDHEFYCRMADLNIWPEPWTRCAATCAQTLRLYAEKYLRPQHDGLPESVRGIFATEEVEA